MLFRHWEMNAALVTTVLQLCELSYKNCNSGRGHSWHGNITLGGLLNSKKRAKIEEYFDSDSHEDINNTQLCWEATKNQKILTTIKSAKDLAHRNVKKGLCCHGSAINCAWWLYHVKKYNNHQCWNFFKTIWRNKIIVFGVCLSEQQRL